MAYFYDIGAAKPYAVIQSALDQVSTDWGVGAFDGAVHVRIFAGTYNESDIMPNAALNPEHPYGFYLVIEGDPADDRENIIVNAPGGTYIFYCNCDSWVLQHLKMIGSPSAWCAATGTGCAKTIIRDLDCGVSCSGFNIKGYRSLLEDVLFVTSGGNKFGVHLSGQYTAVRGCRLKARNPIHSYWTGHIRVEGTEAFVDDSPGRCIGVAGNEVGQDAANLDVVNSSLKGSSSYCINAGAGISRVKLINTLMCYAGQAIMSWNNHANDDSPAAGAKYGATIEAVHCAFWQITNVYSCSNGNYPTLAQAAAANSRFTHIGCLESDPGLTTDPPTAIGHMKPAVDSPLINGGVGAGVLYDCEKFAAPNLHFPAIGAYFSRDVAQVPSMESRVGTTLLRSGVR